ncbi:uncharacterized protein LOC124260250 [Haliotis rubra]|uniref:uncharacterized protein LOC124260250 n=1 Tax=Haliotis rubra TaxID=36100 RepID=UPI001EE56BF7|nr:uncharacterized protein LOC124260250 [Haliotis rubra]
MQLKSICLLALVLGTSDAYQCCPPARWKTESFYTRLELQTNVASYHSELEEFFQDLDNSRFASVVERRYYRNILHLKIISDHKTMVKYTIDRDRNRCPVEHNHDPVHTFCIPDSATPGFQVKLGFGDNSLEATAYYDEDTLKDDKYQRGIWYLVNEACIPLQRDRTGLDEGKQKAMNFFEVIRYKASIEKLSQSRL